MVLNLRPGFCILKIFSYCRLPEKNCRYLRPIDHLRWKKGEITAFDFEEVRRLVEKIREELKTPFSSVEFKTGFRIKF